MRRVEGVEGRSGVVKEAYEGGGGWLVGEGVVCSAKGGEAGEVG